MAGSNAEKLVEEWLNRQGFFTIRQVSSGQGDIDILAVKLKEDGNPCCRHYEVQGADKPMGYIVPYKSSLTKKRTESEMKIAIQIWLKNRFLGKAKINSDTESGLFHKAEIREKIARCNWTFHFVIHNVKYPEELEILKNECENGEIKVKVTRLIEIRDRLHFQRYLGLDASEKDLVNLATMDNEDEQKRRFKDFLINYMIEPNNDENNNVNVKELKMHLKDNKNISRWLREIEELNYKSRGRYGHFLLEWKLIQDIFEN